MIAIVDCKGIRMLLGVLAVVALTYNATYTAFMLPNAADWQIPLGFDMNAGHLITSDDEDLSELHTLGNRQLLNHGATSSREATSLLSQSRPTVGGIPKIIWMYWDQGLDHLKKLGESNTSNKYQADFGCVQGWKILHPTWDVRILNKTAAQKIAPLFAQLSKMKTKGRKICAVKLSDLLRLELLTLYGGVYVDTSLCPMRPLDDYLAHLVDKDGFFAPPLHFSASKNRTELEDLRGCDRYPVSSSPDSDPEALSKRSRSLSTWLLAAHPRHVLIEGWMIGYYKRLREAAKECSNPCGCLPYFVAHCIFTLRRLADVRVDDAWTKFRTRVINEHAGFWRKNKREGGCFGGTNKSFSREVNMNVRMAMDQCYYVKKQSGPLFDFVRSSAYLEAMSQKVPTSTA